MGENISNKSEAIISDLRKFQETFEQISKAGTANFQVISDFDGTLTRANFEGKKVPSIISVLRDGSYLTPDYAQKAHELYNIYRPIEKDHSIDPGMEFVNELLKKMFPERIDGV